MKCRGCGANITPSKDAKYIQCPYCGTFNDVEIKKTNIPTYFIRRPTVKPIYIVFAIIIIMFFSSIIFMFAGKGGGTSFNEFYSPAYLANCNNDDILDIVGTIGTVSKGEKPAIIDGLTGKILFKANNFVDLGYITEIFSPTEDYVCYVTKDLVLTILRANDFSEIGTVMLPDGIKKYNYINDTLFMFFFDNTQVGIDLETARSTETSMDMPDNYYRLYNNVYHQQLDNDGVMFVASEKSGSEEFIIITAIKDNDTLWQTVLRYKNVQIVDDPVILLVDNTVITYGTKLGDDDYGYIIGLDKSTGMIRYEQKQNSTWSSGVTSFIYNGKYVIVTWGFGVHAYDPNTGENVWNIGGR